jgi:hypothetical protein
MMLYLFLKFVLKHILIILEIGNRITSSYLLYSSTCLKLKDDLPNKSQIPIQGISVLD